MSRQVNLSILVPIALLLASPVDAASIYLDKLYGVSTAANIIYAYGNTTTGLIPLKLDIYRPTNIGIRRCPHFRRLWCSKTAAHGLRLAKIMNA